MEIKHTEIKTPIELLKEFEVLYKKALEEIETKEKVVQYFRLQWLGALADLEELKKKYGEK